MRRSIILALAMGIGLIPKCVTSGANALIMEGRPPVHRFFDARNIGLQAINVVVMTADLVSTQRALQIPGMREMNPVAGSPGGLLALKIVGAGAGLGMAYVMHRSGHHKAERVIPLLFAAPSGFAAVHNAGIQR